MEYTRLRHSDLSVCRICLGCMTYGVPEANASQPEDQLVPKLIKPARHMDDMTALRSLGLSLPSPAYLFGAVVFGLIGIGAYRLGKRAQRPRTKWLGVALMLYPYAISLTWMLYVVGAALCVAIYMDRG